jgi:hypothetical protein
VRIQFLGLVVVACNSAAKPPPDLDASALHRILTTTSEALRIEHVQISPDHGNARYEIVWKDRGKHSNAIAEFPGTFTDEMVAARVPYAVGARDAGVHTISMTELRAALQCGARQPRCDEATAITAVKIVKLDERARYEVTRSRGTEVAYGEYPGRVVDELRASGIAFTEAP